MILHELRITPRMKNESGPTVASTHNDRVETSMRKEIVILGPLSRCSNCIPGVLYRRLLSACSSSSSRSKALSINVQCEVRSFDIRPTNNTLPQTTHTHTHTHKHDALEHPNSSLIVTQRIVFIQGGLKIGTLFVRLFSLSESGENL